MALVEIHLGRYIECMRALWPHLFNARSLVMETDMVLSSLESVAPASPAVTTGERDARQEQQVWIEEFMRKTSPFLERNSIQRESVTEFLQNPAIVLPQVSYT
jgi:hypothetical protein